MRTITEIIMGVKMDKITKIIYQNQRLTPTLARNNSNTHKEVQFTHKYIEFTREIEETYKNKLIFLLGLRRLPFLLEHNRFTSHMFTTLFYMTDRIQLTLSQLIIHYLTAFFFSDPWTMHLFSSTILTANTLTFLLHPNWKKTASFLFSIMK